MDLAPQLADESRVLVIYTGGTIGMLVGQQGYVPEPHFLTETLRSQTRFHDPLQNSLFSNSGSVQGFREWSSGSGRTSPSGNSPTTETVPQHPTLLVRSSRNIGGSSNLQLPGQKESSKDQYTCTQVSDDVYEAHLPSLVTPRSTVPGSGGTKSIRYAVLEWDPLLDSSNVEMNGKFLFRSRNLMQTNARTDWIRIATEIELNYSFDAFVILHGTDTMSYSASALSFLLEDLGKTVILTGAQIPLSQLRNDAIDNLMGALTIAGHYIIPECCLYFNHTLYRGNRVSKISSHDLSAFDSPNFPPLVNVGIDIVVNWKDVIRQTSLRRFSAHKQMSPHVATLRLFPGITTGTVNAFFVSPMRGVVLETFGSGNAPQRPDLMQALKDACDRGIVVVAITQCTRGSVSNAYETGRTLLKAGVVPGGDMTPECALAKLSYLLSKPELSIEEVRKLMGVPLRGELTRPPAAAPPSLETTIEQNIENLQGVLSHFMRLSQPVSRQGPAITITDLDDASQNAAATWSWTAAEASSTETVLLPFLIHLAAARNDVESIRFCIGLTQPLAGSANPIPEMPKYANIPGGMVNCLEPGSGRSPLHIAAFNGHLESVNLLLQSGALVHLRDALGHTALYYAARQNHREVVDVLVQSGAALSGMDGTYSVTAAGNALKAGDDISLQIWSAAGVRLSGAASS